MRIPMPSYLKSLFLGTLASAVVASTTLGAPGKSDKADQASFSVYAAKHLGGKRVEEEAAVEIRLRAKAMVRGWEFTIGDVADLSPADTKLASEVKEIVVSRSPLPGYDQRVTSEIIRMVIHGKVRDRSKIQIKGGTSCVVKTASVRVDSQTFVNAGKQHILRQLPWPASQVEVVCASEPQARYVPVGVGNGPVLEIVDADNVKDRGTVRVRARILVDGRTAYQALLSYNIKTFQDVVVASGNIARGELLSPENSTLERREIRDFSFGFFTDLRKTYGKMAKSNIRAGATLTAKQIEAPPVVGRKSIVNVVYQSGRVRISLKGIAEDAGAPGDLIRVRNLTSRKQLWCQVVNRDTVQVTNVQ